MFFVIKAPFCNGKKLPPLVIKPDLFCIIRRLLSYMIKLYLISNKLRFEGRYFISSVIRQEGESQNGCFKKAKHAKISEKQTFLTS